MPEFAISFAKNCILRERGMLHHLRRLFHRWRLVPSEEREEADDADDIGEDLASRFARLRLHGTGILEHHKFSFGNKANAEKLAARTAVGIVTDSQKHDC